MKQTIRDSTLGQLVRWATSNRYFRYPEEKQGLPTSSDGSAEKDLENAGQEGEEKAEKQNQPSTGNDVDGPAAVLDQSTDPVLARKTLTNTDILVDWGSKDDPENPQNWPTVKKLFVLAQLMLYTFSVYSSASIYVPAEGPLRKLWGLNQTEVSLGLSLYVLGYGTGSLLFSPLSEVPRLGRNIPYITTYALFVILAVPTALVDNYAGFLVLRFITGFLGSPCLATAGATVQDMFPFHQVPFAISVWTCAGYAGPSFGPILSAFAVPAINWRIAMWEILWLAGPTFLLLFVFFPETSADNILLRRAQRLRAITGNKNYRSQSEIKQANMSLSSTAYHALLIPFQINLLDPAVLFVNLFTAYVYGVYYSYFEVLPFVYVDIYGFSVGQTSIVFLSIFVSISIGLVIYFAWLIWVFFPNVVRNGGMKSQEDVLVPALWASFVFSGGLFIFAWTSREDIHWIASVVGLTITNIGNWIIFQCVFMWLPISYPVYAASLFAANNFWRSALAAGSILFAYPLFTNLGVGKGVSVLGGLAAGGILGIWSLWWFGARLRARSRFAVAETK